VIDELSKVLNLTKTTGGMTSPPHEWDNNTFDYSAY